MSIFVQCPLGSRTTYESENLQISGGWGEQIFGSLFEIEKRDDEWNGKWRCLS